MEQGLDEAQRQCRFCLVTLGTAVADHPPSKCSATPGLDLTTSEQLRDGVAYDWRNRCQVCYKCRVGEQNCKAIKREESCRWGGAVVELVPAGSMPGGVARGGLRGGRTGSFWTLAWVPRASEGSGGRGEQWVVAALDDASL